jgi:hypothetical protein
MAQSSWSTFELKDKQERFTEPNRIQPPCLFSSQLLKAFPEIRSFRTHQGVPEGKIKPLVVVELFVMVVLVLRADQPFGQ